MMKNQNFSNKSDLFTDPTAKRKNDMAESDKEHISLCVCGHVDAGKSSLCGHLLFELGGVSEREVETLKKEAEALGKGSFAFAFYMDKQKQERERGITISCATKEFNTDSKHYTIIDAPGHKSFILNMIKGAAQADVGLLMVPAGGGFATATAIGNRKKGQQEGQSRQHAFLLSLLGIKQLIVGVNKMDDVDYSEERFNEIKEEMVHMLSKSGWRSKFVNTHVPIIPISGYYGENLTKKSEKMPWWKGTTVKNLNKEDVHVTTLLDAFDKMAVVPKRNTEGALRVPISGVYNIKGVGDVITGRVEQGTLKPGTEVKFLPSHTPENTCAGKVFTVEMHHKSVPGAYPGDNVGMNVKNLPKDKKRKPRVGDVMVLKTDETVKPCKRFTMKSQVLSHPGELGVGYSPIGVVRTSRSALKIVEIKWKKSGKKGSVKEENPKFIKQGDSCELVIEPQQSFVVEKFKNCEGLGRVALLDGNSVVMVGMVVDVEFKE